MERVMEQRPVIKRRRIKQVLTLKERLLQSADEASERAALLPPGLERHKLLRWARVTRTTAGLDDWLTPHGLRPPR